ncbi:hypothetical protein NFJ02_06g126230 [Pycnococcus provasolii]
MAASSSGDGGGGGGGDSASLSSLQRENDALRAKIKLLVNPAGERALGELKGVNAMNQALWRMNAFQHQPPEFRYFDPVLSEQLEVEMKEVRLPFSDQTHEMCYEPVSRCLFISQMSNSVLVRIPVGANGMLLDDQDAWRVGPVDKDSGDGISGLHNLSLSPANPGCLWLSLQSANTILLVEGATMKVRKVMKVPTMLVRKDKTAVLVGGPHCVRECPRTGNVWVALKGSQGCHPGHVPGVAELSGKRGFALAKERVCCDAKALRKRMDTLAGLGYDSPPPEGYAVWRVKPDEYDPSHPECGGSLYETLPSPPMVAVDHEANCWVAQDTSKTIMRIQESKPPADACCQMEIPHPHVGSQMKCSMQVTGPAVVVAPDGGIWCSLLGAQGGLVRICPEKGTRTRYEFPIPPWMHTARFIHVVFHMVEDVNIVFGGSLVTCGSSKTAIKGFKGGVGCPTLFAISSNLIEDDAMNALYMVIFDSTGEMGWSEPIATRVMPLATQDCSCHRIEVISEGLPPEDHSICVSELHTSKIFQVKICNALAQMDGLVEEDMSVSDPDSVGRKLKDGYDDIARRFHDFGGITKYRGMLREEGVPIMGSSIDRFEKFGAALHIGFITDGVLRGDRTEVPPDIQEALEKAEKEAVEKHKSEKGYHPTAKFDWEDITSKWNIVGRKDSEHRKVTSRKTLGEG